MNKNQIVKRLDEISQIVRARMDTVEPTMIGLLPTEYDWMTPEEKEETHKLKLQLPSYGQEAVDARERLKNKRNRNFPYNPLN